MFSDFPEQLRVAQLLQRSLERHRLAHAYLFTGNGLGELEAMALFRKWLDEESALPPRVCAGKNSG